MSSPSNQAILEAAGQLFGERGYRAVTVRDIAAGAGVSAALVIKNFASKAKLFAAVRPDETQITDLDVPTSELGGALVFRVLVRRKHGLPEPWAMIPLTIQDSPDPEATWADTRERYLASIAELIGDSTPERRFAATVIALMTGFGEGMRTLGLFEGWDFDDVLAHYGGIVQAQIDACGVARASNTVPVPAAIIP